MQEISLKDLLEAGCHFGHQANRWHPKAASFIYQTREGIHIIDLVHTKQALEKAAEAVKKLAMEDGILLMVGTKRQAKGVVTQVAKNAGIPYLTQRWIGGFITNWEEVKKNIDKMNEMRRDRQEGKWSKFPKHEQLALEKDLRRLEMFYGGVADLSQPPDMVYLVDIKKEEAAVKETNKRNIETIAIVDTNSDPTLVTYPIPANDDAVKSIEYITSYIAQAYLEGKNVRQKKDKAKAENKEAMNKEAVNEE